MRPARPRLVRPRGARRRGAPDALLRRAPRAEKIAERARRARRLAKARAERAPARACRAATTAPTCYRRRSAPGPAHERAHGACMLTAPRVTDMKVRAAPTTPREAARFFSARLFSAHAPLSPRARAVVAHACHCLTWH